MQLSICLPSFSITPAASRPFVTRVHMQALAANTHFRSPGLKACGVRQPPPGYTFTFDQTGHFAGPSLGMSISSRTQIAKCKKSFAIILLL